MHETTNPTLIMLINMTIVFAVLFFLSIIIRLIKVADNLLFKKKPEVQPTPPVTTPVTVQAEPVGMSMEDKALVAVLTTAIMAYGYQDVRIRSIVKK